MPGCTLLIPRRLLACAPHWRELPLELKVELRASYRRLREAGGHLRHTNAVRACLRWYAQQTDI